MSTFFKRKLTNILASADITIDGTGPWDIRVHDDRFYQRVLTESHLGIGESYMDGWWDCDALDEFFFRVLRARLDTKVSKVPRMINNLIGKTLNLQNKSRAYTVGETHYNIGNDLYEAMLDNAMMYSCAYWKNAQDLNQAQENKLHLIFRKLMLKPGMNLLDIGCGWGGAAKFAAEHYGATVTGLTVSTEQVKLAREKCAGLPVKIELMDYRNIKGNFDRIYSIGMFEHVGHKNYRNYFQIVQKSLKQDGLFLLHTIGSNRSGTNTDKWTEKYIFPNSMLPSANHITKAAEGMLTMEDWHSFGHDYYLTLKAWNDNILKNRAMLGEQYQERFFRMWHYYLLSAAGSFRARNVQLWQILYSYRGIEGAFDVPR
ncbi:cyclopropane fatty acyl phospholipid synthase [Chlorobium phaeobacteroides]|uniref:Cyclopropane-fatty-acyl-phospholipid synthase n=1 Tax=Chlorobium phaeobacteroides (strain DSM 266 / SMG 266 / 2430) TaxID=290317 RepID=A1BFE0_CHLPD|nr:cyclopropane fatty acyl phospholipid synthase [Chlorobium phaeobacteroides]ABL65117.1 cyclopropane-fatty-acyl-phospholipid synthase [Chlorobium phaeobacteroides DSM 266]